MSQSKRIVTAAGAVVVLLSISALVAQTPRFDVNDVAYLWPAPATAADVDRLITAAETLEPVAGGQARLWPAAPFDLLLTAAQAASVTSSAGTTVTINFAQFADEFRRPETWKVLGVRIDPSAPGSHPSLIAQFGSTPQIRLVLQPVTVRDGAVTVHDVTAHLAYSFVTRFDPQTRMPTPNTAVFAEVVKELAALKAQAEAAGSPTSGPLGVHPALARNVPGFADGLRALLKRRLAEGVLTEMAFMGIDPPEPWIFFAMVRRPDGAFVQVGAPPLGGHMAQMLTFRGGTPVMPAPATTNVDAKTGVSTAPLFRRDAESLAGAPVIPGTAGPLHQDIPDIIANPRLSNVRNTDCVSCHTESTRRSILKLASADPSLAFERPEHVSGIDPAVLPQGQWNVRNFGMFQTRDGKIHPTITMRTANEVAEAVEFVNREYLTAARPAPSAAQSNTNQRIPMPAPQPVASPLTLVMTVKSPENMAALKALLQKIQGLPEEQNPVRKALTKLSTVHFARFVFLNDRQLAVITTYDGSFEDYIDAFVNSIGTVFDQILAHMADAPPLPVSEHRKEFLDYVRRNDIQPVPPFYSAYPHLKVLDILTLDKERQQ